MTIGKETAVTIGQEGKETFSERLRTLIGQRSIRSAAKAWGLSFSTLNNYLSKGTDPSLSAIRGIADVEEVSIDWLALRTNEKKMNHQSGCDALPVVSADVPERLLQTWLMILESIEPDEASLLIKTVHKKGVDQILSINNELNAQFLSLSETEKRRVMQAHETYSTTDSSAKKGASEECDVNEAGNLASDKRQAG